MCHVYILNLLQIQKYYLRPRGSDSLSHQTYFCLHSLRLIQPLLELK